MDTRVLYGALEDYMDARADLPKLQLIPLDLDGENEGIDVFAFSYMMGRASVPSIGMRSS